MAQAFHSQHRSMLTGRRPAHHHLGLVFQWQYLGYVCQVVIVEIRGLVLDLAVRLTGC